MKLEICESVVGLASDLRLSEDIVRVENIVFIARG